MKIKNDENYYIDFKILKILDEEYHLGGKCIEIMIDAKVSFLTANFCTYTSTVVLKNLYNKLLTCYEISAGLTSIKEFNYENDITLSFYFSNLGHAKVNMTIKSNDEHDNKCEMCFYTDQTFIAEFLLELKKELIKLNEF